MWLSNKFLRFFFVLASFVFLVACSPVFAVPSPTMTEIVPTVTPSPVPDEMLHWTPRPTTANVLEIQKASSDNLPALSADLLFLSEGQLMWWNHTINEIAVLVGKDALQPYLAQTVNEKIGKVLYYSASADGSRIAFSFVIDDADNEHLLGYAVYDTQARQIIDLERQYWTSVGSNYLRISPDGKWVALFKYFRPDYGENGKGQRGLSAFMPAVHQGGGPAFQILFVSVDDPQLRWQFSSCGGKMNSLPQCVDALWFSADEFLISDATGIQMLNPEQRTASLLYQNQDEPLYLSLDGGIYSENYLFFSNRSFSSDFKVLDLKTGDTQAIENVMLVVEDQTQKSAATWVDRDKLFMFWDDGRDDEKIIWEMWQVNTDAGITLNRLEHRVIETPESNVVPTYPTYLDNGKIGFALMGMDLSYFQSGVYLFRVEDGLSYKVNGLPPLAKSTLLYWVPDGSGVLLHDRKQSILLYVPTDAGVIYELHLLIGEGANLFTWIP